MIGQGVGSFRPDPRHARGVAVELLLVEKREIVRLDIAKPDFLPDRKLD